MNGPSLEGVWGKLDRADEHLQILQREAAAFAESDAYKARGELEPDGAHYVFKIRAPDEFPLRLGLILGDVVQNMRAALDHLVWQLVIASGAEPSRRNAFPIFVVEPVSGSARAAWDAAVDGLNSAYLAGIERVQPHRAQEAPHDRSLAVLRDFSNADKHQVVLPVGLVVTEDLRVTPSYEPHDLEVTGQATASVGQVLKGTTEILRVPVRLTGPDPHMKVHGDIPIDVAFGERQYSAAGFGAIRAHVRHTVKRFEDLLNLGV